MDTTIEALIKQEFVLDDKLIYLNHAAVSPWPRRTALAVKHFAEENAYSGAQYYPRWVEQENLLRQQLKRLVNAPSTDDIALLKNTSEGLSVVAEGINWEPGDNIVSTNQEFPSNRLPWLAQVGVTFREVDIAVDQPSQAVIEACDEKTRLITVSSVQYGSGQRLDLEKIGRFCRANQILFCIDAIQSLGVIPLDVQAVNADFVAADAHKWLLGPEGIALFYCAESARAKLRLRQFGWHMVKHAGNYDLKDSAATSSAKRFECGSLNMLGIHALAASLSLFEEIGVEKISQIIINKVLHIIDFIKNKEQISILSPTEKSQLGGIITFASNHKNNQEIYRKLLNNNIICAYRKGGIRFSPHFYTSDQKIDKSLDILDTII